MSRGQAGAAHDLYERVLMSLECGQKLPDLPQIRLIEF
jgi:hypothetical protein